MGDVSSAASHPVDPRPYDALLLVSFGGPEKPEDVVPFLENVTRGRGIPRERLEEVELHHFEGAHCTGEGAVRRFAGLSTIADGGSRELRVGDRFVLESP